MPDPHLPPPRNCPASTSVSNTNYASWHASNPAPPYWPSAPPPLSPPAGPLIPPAPPAQWWWPVPPSSTLHQQPLPSPAQSSRPVAASGPSFVPRHRAPDDAAGPTQLRGVRTEGVDTGEEGEEEDDDDTVVGEARVEEPEDDDDGEGEEDGRYNRVRECCEGDDPGWCSGCRCWKCRKKQHLSGVALITEDIREEKEEQRCPMNGAQVEELRKALEGQYVFWWDDDDGLQYKERRCKVCSRK